MIFHFRWWLFKSISVIGWRICPEPHKSRLRAVMLRWEDPRIVKMIHEVEI